MFDGEIRSAHEDVLAGSLRFAPDGHRLALVARHTNEDGADELFVRVGEAEHGPYDEVSSAPVFSRSGHAAWCARRGPDHDLVVDGRTVASFDARLPESRPTWTDDRTLRMLALRGHRIVSVTAALP